MFRLSRVLLEGGSIINLLYLNTLEWMEIPRSRIHTKNKVLSMGLYWAQWPYPGAK
jgi:hypothetical protein